MNPLASMRLRMQETGLYALSGDTAVDWELEAYAEGLDLLYEQIYKLMRDLFPETADEDGLSLWESLFGLSGQGMEKEERRRRLLLRVSAVPGTKAGLIRLGESLGIPVSIAEEPGTIYCMAYSDPDEEEVSRFLRSFGGFVPAHLQILLDLRPLSWSQIQAQGRSWQQMDVAALSWKDIESLGKGIIHAKAV